MIVLNVWFPINSYSNSFAINLVIRISSQREFLHSSNSPIPTLALIPFIFRTGRFVTIFSFIISGVFLSLILIFIAIIKISENLLINDNLLLEINNIFIILSLALQIFFFGVYIALLRRKINLSTDNKIYNFFKYFNLGKSFILSFLIFILAFLFLFQNKYFFIIKSSIFLFLLAISVVVFINSILISLLELIEDKKI